MYSESGEIVLHFIDAASFEESFQIGVDSAGHFGGGFFGEGDDQDIVDAGFRGGKVFGITPGEIVQDITVSFGEGEGFPGSGGGFDEFITVQVQRLVEG